MFKNIIHQTKAEKIKYLDSIAFETDYLSFGPGELSLTSEDEVKIIKNAVKSNNQYFVIAEYEERVIGVLTFSGWIKSRSAHTGELGISVLKEFWGNQIASQMINDFIIWAKNNDKITKIDLRVREDNKKAINLYKKIGFEVEGLIKRAVLINHQYYNLHLMGKLIDWIHI